MGFQKYGPPISRVPFWELKSCRGRKCFPDIFSFCGGLVNSACLPQYGHRLSYWIYLTSLHVGNLILVQRKTRKKSEKLQKQNWPFILGHCMRKLLFQKNETICSSYWLYVPSLYHEEISVLSKRKLKKILKQARKRQATLVRNYDPAAD